MAAVQRFLNFAVGSVFLVFIYAVLSGIGTLLPRREWPFLGPNVLWSISSVVTTIEAVMYFGLAIGLICAGGVILLRFLEGAAGLGGFVVERLKREKKNS